MENVNGIKLLLAVAKSGDSATPPFRYVGTGETSEIICSDAPADEVVDNSFPTVLVNPHMAHFLELGVVTLQAPSTIHDWAID